MEKISLLFINLQVRQVAQMLREAVSSMPSPVQDSEMPRFFRERYIHTGYRTLHQGWRYYILSVFQCHNETINVWTHLLGALLVLIKTAHLAENIDFIGDPHSWPLLVLHGDHEPYIFVLLYVVTTISCVYIAAYMLKKVRQLLEKAK